jgi:hypothetical protein
MKNHCCYGCCCHEPTESFDSTCHELFLPNDKHDDELFRVLLSIVDSDHGVQGDDASYLPCPSHQLQLDQDAHSRTTSPTKKTVKKNSNDTSFTKICSQLSLPRHASFKHIKDKLEVNGLFFLPIRQAAKKLSVSESSLKRLCRKMNISRWPYRKILRDLEKYSRIIDSLH